MIKGLEIKLSGFIIGMMELMWATSTLWDTKGRIALVMDLYGTREEFGLLLAISGLLIVTGSVFPCRNIRHWGLLMCPLVVFPAAGVAVMHNMVSFGTLLLPFIGAMALLTMWFDARGKPREKRRAGE